MDRKLRRLVLLVAVLFAATLLCSAFMMAFAAGHSCHHKECQICAIVSVCQSVVKTLAGITALILWGQATVCLGTVFQGSLLPLTALPTPVSNKVKLSN